jgi:predicted anti-sigma-YlaC factor YlaD
MMSALSCVQVRDLAPELALGVLSGADRAEVLLHIDWCPTCRAHVNELSETVDALALLAPEAEPPVGFEKRLMHSMGIERHRGWRAIVLSRWAAAAAVVGLLVAGSILGALAGLGIIGGHKSQFQAEYVQALKKMGGKSLRAAPMVAAAGTPSGEAFAYKGKQSWVFVSVSYSSMPSGSYTVMLDDAEGSHVVGTIKVADGHGVLGAQAPGSAGTANGVRLVNGDGQLMCEALFTS